MDAPAMESDNFDEQMREAVLFVMNHLPDKRKDPQDVLAAAERLLGQNGRSEEGLAVLVELVKKLPRCYGVERKKGFWEIAKHFVADEDDLLQAYLSWVPDRITGNQRRELQQYLLEQGFDDLKVYQALRRFGHRNNIGRAKAGW